VFEAKIAETGEIVAIKKVLQDKRFKVRSARTGCCGATTDVRSRISASDCVVPPWTEP